MKKVTNIMIYSFIMIGLIIAVSTSCKKKSTPEIPATVTDIDGYVYHTVKIGSQVWMVENLRVTRFNNGMSVELAGGAKSAGEWDTPRYCWYSDSVSKSTYGALYNYRVLLNDYVGSPKIAPKGWHVPSDAEWRTLISNLGGDSLAGGKMKSKGTLGSGGGLWASPNTGATNESGFTAYPGGRNYYSSQVFSPGYLGYRGFWWSSSYTQWNPSSFELSSGNAAIINQYSSSFGADFLSIRCIMD